MRALERDRSLRYATAREMGKELNRALVQSGTVIGYAELARWMQELFPDGLAQKRKLLETAVRDTAGASEQCTRSVASDPVEAAATRLWQRPSVLPDSAPASDRPPVESARTRRLRLGWRGSFGAAAVLTGMGMFFWLHGFDLGRPSRGDTAAASVIGEVPRASQRREPPAGSALVARPAVDVAPATAEGAKGSDRAATGMSSVEVTNGPYVFEITSGADATEGVLVRIRPRKPKPAPVIVPARLRLHQEPLRSADGGALGNPLGHAK
jgi:hypothetical protein